MYIVYYFINNKWVSFIKCVKFAKVELFFERYKKFWPQSTFKVSKKGKRILGYQLGGQE